MSSPRRWRVLAAGGFAAAAVTAMVVAAPTPAGAVPAPPAGYTLVFRDDFNGAAGTRLNETNWLYDIGTSYPGGAANWGTGEIETDDQRLGQRQHGRRRPPRDHPAAGRRRQLDLGPDRDPAHRLRRRPAASCASRRRSSSPTSPAPRPPATGRRSGRWAPRPARSARPTGRASARSTSWRTINGLSSVFGTSTADRPSRAPATRPPDSAAARCLPRLPDRLPHYGVEWDRSVTRRQLRWYRDGVVYFSLNREPGRRDDLEQRHQPRLLHHPQRGHGRRLPGRVRRRPDRGDPLRRADAGRLRRGLLRRRRQRPRAAAAATTPPPPGGTGRVRARSRPSRTTPRRGTQTEATTDAGGGQNIGCIANGDWAAVPERRLRQQRRRTSSAPGSPPARRRGERPGRGAAGQPDQRADRQLRDRQHRRLADAGGRSRRTSAAVTGVHTVFLTFTSGQPADFVNVNWFTFAH